MRYDPYWEIVSQPIILNVPLNQKRADTTHENHAPTKTMPKAMGE